ncbi:MAG: hypothetical protein AAB508_06170, partial [Patescibacteria group bacterium]
TTSESAPLHFGHTVTASAFSVSFFIWYLYQLDYIRHAQDAREKSLYASFPLTPRRYLKTSKICIVRSRRGGRELLAGVYPESFRGTRRIGFKMAPRKGNVKKKRCKVVHPSGEENG